MKRIAILGSTGSIGTQTLDVVREHADEYEAYALTAGHNAELLIAQAREFHPEVVVIADESRYETVREALADLPIKVWAGAEAIGDAASLPDVDVVVTAMVGFAGLRPTVAAIEAGKTIALANKETLVVAGELITELAVKHRAPILPVDSEHSAIFQSLVGDADASIEKILLTCSGGPFRHFTPDQLKHVTAADALRHPTWSMGDKITIDSATLMNKGFEVIEAKWLFGVEASQIEVLIHPQSIVHSGVQFVDGSVKAQLGVPDMRLPIQYAFSFPERLPLQGERLDLFAQQKLEFFQPDVQRFRCLGLAYEAIERGGNMSCILNAANEVVNEAFRNNLCSFPDMARTIEATMAATTFEAQPSLEALLQTDTEARAIARELLGATK